MREFLDSGLARGATGSFTVQVLNTALTFVIGLIAARLLGPEGLGVYKLSISWVAILAIFCGLGFDQLLIRDVAAYVETKRWNLLRGVLRLSNVSAGICSVVASTIGTVVAIFVLDLSPAGRIVFVLALWTLPLHVLTRLRGAALQGLSRPVLGQLPETTIRPVILLGLILVAYVCLGEKVNATIVMGAYVVSVAISFAVGAVLLYRNRPRPSMSGDVIYAPRTWFKAVPPLISISGMYVVNRYVDVLMVGALLSNRAVGIYAVAATGAQLVVFVLRAANRVLAPEFSKFHARRDRKGLENLAVVSARQIFFASLPITGILIIGGNWFLGLHGSDFTEGYIVLVILCIGHVASAAAGSVGYLLLMTGNERAAALNVGAAALTNIVLNAILIPHFGMVGAAIATAISTILVNGLQALSVYRCLGIVPTAAASLVGTRS